MAMDAKVRENRLRRMADRQGLQLLKSRRRDPQAYDFGTYMLVDQEVGGTVHPLPANRAYGLDLDEIEELLKGT